MGTVALGARFIIRLQLGLKIEPSKYVIIVLPCGIQIICKSLSGLLRPADYYRVLKLFRPRCIAHSIF